MKGIDISNNDLTIDFTQVKNAGYEVCIIKATEGKTYTDPYLKTNYEGAKEVGLKVGFYHFLRANNPVDEAKHFLEAIEGLSSDCLYFIDVEVPLGQSVSKISYNVKQFAEYLISQGKKPGIYTYSSFYDEYLNDTVKFYPVWIANYGRNKPCVSNMVGWQYSETGNVTGVPTNCDLNIFDAAVLIGNEEIATPENAKLKAQIEALEYWLNIDYNAKLTHTDGTYTEDELYPNLEEVGNLIVKGHKSHLVQWIQQKLMQWGFLGSGQDTGIYDEKTFQAVTNLQKAWQRETSGKILISNNTWQIFLNN